MCGVDIKIYMNNNVYCKRKYICICGEFLFRLDNF